MRKLFLALAGAVAVAAASLAALLLLTPPAAPPPVASLGAADDAITASEVDYPAATLFTARDGASLAYRHYAGAPGGGLVVLVHGSSGNARAVHRASKALAAAGITVIAPDIRGHGDSGRHGDIAYLGQLDDDMVDLVRALPAQDAGERRVLAGHSSGGGFVLREAAGPMPARSTGISRSRRT